MLVYFSNVSNQTKRFVDKLDLPNARIPLYTKDETLIMEEPYILVVPSYGTGNVKRAVPPQVVKFLNVEQNREHLLGVIGTGNKNFGRYYQIAARIISHKTQKPIFYTLELMGVQEDVDQVREMYATIVP